MLEVQDPWRDPEKADYLLQLIPDADLRSALRAKWEDFPERGSAAKWADIDTLAQSSTGSSSSGGGRAGRLDARALLEAKQDIVLEHTYPRLDVVVTQQLSHLLKSPFVVHPGTGRICVPIDTRTLDDFDPFNVPTLQGLVHEIDAWAETAAAAATGEDKDKNSSQVKQPQDWEKTSLKPYIEYFRSFVTALMKDERAVTVKRERDDEQEQAGSLDF